jgi:hypothetical protein
VQLFHIIKETMRRCCRKGLLGIASAAVLLLCGHESGPVYHCAAATRINNSDDITAAVPSSSSPSSLPTFFFYLKPFESDRRASYQHPVVALGEGLCALWQKGRREQRPSSSGNAATGDENSHCWWPSNVDYWPTVTSPADPKYLFRRQLLRDIAASATAAPRTDPGQEGGGGEHAHVVVVVSALADTRLLPQKLLAPYKWRRGGRVVAVRDLGMPSQGTTTTRDDDDHDNDYQHQHQHQNQNQNQQHSTEKRTATTGPDGDEATTAAVASAPRASKVVRISTVFVDWRDGIYFNRVAGANFDLYFKAHFASYVKQQRFNASGNLRVGSFYLTNRILAAANAVRGEQPASPPQTPWGAAPDVAPHLPLPAPAAQNASGPFVLFPHGGARLNLDVRSFAWNEFYASASLGDGAVATDHDGADRWTAADGGDGERFWWEATGHRHSPSFFRRLAAFAACDCSGGYFYDRDTSETITGTALTASALSRNKRSVGVFQWESFKLWESFAVGCAVIMPDLERFGLELPVMPTPWEHYLPLRLDSRSELDELEQRVLSMSASDLRAVGERGRAWALENFSPDSWAKRLMQELTAVVVGEGGGGGGAGGGGGGDEPLRRRATTPTAEAPKVTARAVGRENEL